MPTSPITIRLDAAQVYPRNTTPAIRSDVYIRDNQAGAVSSGVWIEPYSGSVICAPKQFNNDWYNDATITRYGKSSWVLTDEHWDESPRGADRWLISDGTDETIQTNATFAKNSGFHLQFFIFGADADLFDALQVWFGQWRLDIRSDGRSRLFSGTETRHRAEGWLTSSSRNTLVDRVSELLIMPSGNGSVFIRRNGVAGFSYTLPADSDDMINGNIIEAGVFKLKAVSSTVRFQLTQLEYDASADCYFITPNKVFEQPPTAEQVLDMTAHWQNLGGAAIAQIYEALEDTQGYDDVSPFEADGVKANYCVGFTVAPDATGKISPFVQGATIEYPPVEPEKPINTSDITADVRSLSISVGDTATDTQATLVIRNPENHPIFGACNRLCTIEAGEQTIMVGWLKDPPEYTYSEDGDRFYTCTVMSIAKALMEPCLRGDIYMDNCPHVIAVAWLCRFAGLLSSDLIYDTDDTPLIDTRTTGTNGEIKSQLMPNAGDQPIDWIDKIRDITGWTFIDGYNETGDYVLKYIDPLAMDITSKHTFVMHSSDEESAESCQRLMSWNVKSKEPECNELYMVGTLANGQRVAARYWDRKSQNPTLAEYDPDADPPQDPATIRPDNWLGIRRIAYVEIPGTVTEDLLTQLAIKVGDGVSKREDVAQFTAAYPVGLWKGDVVTIMDSDETNPEPGVGDYRITSLQIDFIDESTDPPIRRAQYEATSNLQTMDVATGKLLRDIRRQLRQGDRSNIKPNVGSVVAQDNPAVATGNGPISKIIDVIDADGIKLFTLGATTLDDSVFVP